MRGADRLPWRVRAPVRRARNAASLFVPCHRVIRSDGTMGAYRGGPAAKRVLLDLERVG